MTNYNFSSKFKHANVISITLFLISIILISFKGLNYGIDFKGGTLIAAIILFAFGSGPVKGFAITLGIGIITTLFTAYFLARHLTSLIVLNNKNKDIKI